MKWLLQLALLNIYKLALITGFLSTALGRKLMRLSYDLYKSRFEASYIQSLQPFIVPNSLVIDVGANVGFFTSFFAEWVNENGHVIAIEPDPSNCKNLQDTLIQNQLMNRVEIVAAAATSYNGKASLQLDPNNPTNHKLGSEGISVDAITVDSLVTKYNLPVSFIKIDVQGAELSVLEGASETIERFHPTLIVEIDEKSLADFDMRPIDILSFLTAQGYTMHLPEDGHFSDALEPTDILNHDSPYLDVIFIYS